MTAGQRTTQDFTLRQDPLQLQAVVVTGTATPTVNLKSSVAVTTLAPAEIEQSAPRSTTEMLRYVPGFTRVESSGGEVNENISMRGILGVEYVMFMEDGLPVFPTMHTFFMNADNLFRYDENIDRMEVVRGGSSALFGSNTPGAIINFLNKTGGDQFQGTMVATGGTEGLARYDLNMNGPIGDDWRYNVGGFYRYDNGVRDPGFAGIRGGQFKGNVTRELDNGYVRFSAKIINDRNQFILDLPFENASSPQLRPRLWQLRFLQHQRGARSSRPDSDRRSAAAAGQRAAHGGVVVSPPMPRSTSRTLFILRNSAQVMHDNQEWNALVPSNAMTVNDFVTGRRDRPASVFRLAPPFNSSTTNHFDTEGNPLPFSTPNDLVAPGQLIHVAKPISALQDQLSLSKAFGKSSVSAGAYFANYTQDESLVLHSGAHRRARQSRSSSTPSSRRRAERPRRSRRTAS